jgi:hypothetical protein
MLKREDGGFMAKESSVRVSRSGTYVVKAAESRPSRVVSSRSNGRTNRPSTSDKRAAHALLKSKRG